MNQCIARPSVIGVNHRSISPCQRSSSLTHPGFGLSCSQNAATSNRGFTFPNARSPSPRKSNVSPAPCQSKPFADLWNSRFPPTRGSQEEQRPEGTRSTGWNRPLAGESTQVPGPPRRPPTSQSMSTPVPDSCRSFGKSQNLSVPMLNMGHRLAERSQTNEEPPQRPFSSLRCSLRSSQEERPFSSLRCPLVSSHEERPFSSLRCPLGPSQEAIPEEAIPAEKNAMPDRRPITLANQFVQNIEAFEKKIELHKQPAANGAQECEEAPRAAPSTYAAVPLLRSTNSPAQQSVYPSDDGSTSEKNKHCSTIPSDESLSTEQLKAYKELEQAEMACELKRMENCLAEERDRSSCLQKMFATELMAQKDAHARDVASLEDMISKVLAENQRLSTMVEGLCGQVDQKKKDFMAPPSPAPSSTCPSGNTTSRSKRSPGQSGSSGDDTPNSLDSRHKNTILHRVHALNKDREANNYSPHPVSSEAEHTTDSEPIPSSDDAPPPQLPKRVWTPKSKIYTSID